MAAGSSREELQGALARATLVTGLRVRDGDDAAPGQGRESIAVRPPPEPRRAGGLDSPSPEVSP